MHCTTPHAVEVQLVANTRAEKKCSKCDCSKNNFLSNILERELLTQNQLYPGIRIFFLNLASFLYLSFQWAGLVLLAPPSGSRSQCGTLLLCHH